MSFEIESRRGSRRSTRSSRSPLEEVRGPSRRRFEFVCWASGTSVYKSVDAADLGVRATSLGKKIGLGSSRALLVVRRASRAGPIRDGTSACHGGSVRRYAPFCPAEIFFAASSSPLT